LILESREPQDPGTFSLKTNEPFFLILTPQSATNGSKVPLDAQKTARQWILGMGASVSCDNTLKAGCLKMKGINPEQNLIYL